STARSSTSALAVEKAMPAFFSKAERKGLLEARISSVMVEIPSVSLFAQQSEDSRRGFLDRPARHVYDRPAVPIAYITRISQFFRDGNAVRIKPGIQRRHIAERPVLADLRNPFGGGDQPDDQRPFGCEQDFRQWNAKHDGNIGGLDAAIGEIN